MSFRVRTLSVFLALSLLRCGSGPSENEPVPDQIVITPAVLRLCMGAVEQLSVVVLDAEGQPIANAPLTFSSGDTTIVTVSTAGVVSAVQAGTGSITVRSSPASTTIPATVFNAAVIAVAPDTVLAQGHTAQLETSVFDGALQPISDAPVTYTSRDESLVTVSGAGLVTAVGLGTANVVATSCGLSDSVYVTSVVARVAVGGRPYGAAVNGVGVAYVTQASIGGVARLDLPTPSVTAGIGVGVEPGSVMFNQAGDRAYVGNQSGASVTVVNVATNGVVATPAFSGSVYGVAVSGDSLLVVATGANRIYFVQLPDLSVTDSVAVAGFSNAMVIQGDLLYASLPMVGSVAEIDIGTRQLVRTFPVGGVPQGLVIPPSGNELYIANEVGKLQIWNRTTNVETANVPLQGGGGFGLARNPSNGLLYVSTSYYGSRVHVIDPTSRAIVRVFRTGGVPRRVAFSASGSVGIVTNEDGWVDFIR